MTAPNQVDCVDIRVVNPDQKLFDAANPNHLDHKQRILPEYLSDSDKLCEILTILRHTSDALEGIVETASKNPMLKMLGIKGL